MAHSDSGQVGPRRPRSCIGGAVETIGSLCRWASRRTACGQGVRGRSPERAVNGRL